MKKEEEVQQAEFCSGSDVAEAFTDSSVSVECHSVVENDILTETETQMGIVYDEEEDPYDMADCKEGSETSVLMSIISQAKKEMDLTKITLPTFILERRSLLEMFAEFLSHPDLFKAIPLCRTPFDRMVATVKFYLSTFHAGRKGSVAKKPYNPVLGEYFQCIYKSEDRMNSAKCSEQAPVEWAQKSDVTFLAEQVSHHPPVSAMYAECESANICFNCHLWTKSRFLGLSIGVQNVGQGVLYLLDHNEEYTMTFPNGYGRNILGVPWFELGGSCKISCPQTEYYCNVEFLTKSFFGGKKHCISAKIYHKDDKNCLLTINGKWNSVMYISKDSDKTEFLNTETEHIFRKYVKSVKSQSSNESRKLWSNVSAALKAGDVKDASKYKTEIEEKQRSDAKNRKEKKLQYNPKYFSPGADKSWFYKFPLYKRINHQYNWVNDLKV